MTREEAKQWLEIYLKTWEEECKSKHPIKEALGIAIKSLDMWDKVIDELNILIQGDNGVVLVQVGEKRALEIIERYKKEIEE